MGIARGGKINYTEYYDGEAYEWDPLEVSDANLSKMNFSVAAGLGVRIPVKIATEKKIYLALVKRKMEKLLPLIKRYMILPVCVDIKE